MADKLAREIEQRHVAGGPLPDQSGPSCDGCYDDYGVLRAHPCEKVRVAAALRDAQAEVRRLRAALEGIERATYGRVCAEFEVCESLRQQEAPPTPL